MVLKVVKLRSVMRPLERSHSGLVRTLGKRVCRKAPRVRISPSPPKIPQALPGVFLSETAIF